MLSSLNFANQEGKSTIWPAALVGLHLIMYYQEIAFNEIFILRQAVMQREGNSKFDFTFIVNLNIYYPIVIDICYDQCHRIN